MIGALPVCRVWKNATGAVKTSSGFIRFGLKGSADILGITSDGRLLAIECKSGQATATKQQRAFKDMVTKFGGRYYLARDAKETYNMIIGLGLEKK